MSSDPTDLCTDLQPRLAAYALGEAEADAALLAHLASCSACQRDLRAYVQVARMLPYDAPEVAPPPSLRDRILAAVEADNPRPAPAPPPVPPTPRRRRLPALWPAFTIAVCIVLLGWNIALQNQLRGQTAQMVSNRQNWQTMIALLNDPAVRWYAINGDTAKGHFWAAPQGQVACLVSQGLPALAAGQVYQVWLMHNGTPTNGGVFEARDGNGWILIRVDESLAEYDSVLVTVEPHDSTMPTGPQVLGGTLVSAQSPTLSDRQGLLRLVVLGAQRGN
jgi:anti-sigma factor RsiW